MLAQSASGDYFSFGSTTGLQIGSPVVFRGVKVGTVESIGLSVNEETYEFLVPVRIKTERYARHALSYVLNNWRRHREDQGRVGLFGGRVDPFSSGVRFEGWGEAIATWPWPTASTG